MTTDRKSPRILEAKAGNFGRAVLQNPRCIADVMDHERQV